MSRYVRIALLTLAVAAGAAMAFEPHRGESLTHIADEYSHISLALQILTEHELPFVNPYLAPTMPHVNLESGFHFLLAGLFAVLGDEPVHYYKYLVPLAFAINALLFFYLVRLWTGAFWPALFAVLFFGTITSRNAILAHEFLLPLTVGIGLLLGGHIAFHRWSRTRERPDMLFLGALIVLMAVFYPPALLFFLATLVFYLLSMDHTLPETINMSPQRFFTITLCAVFLGTFASAAILDSFGLLDHTVFTASWDITHLSASPIFYFGEIPSVLAAIGLIALAVSDRPRSRMIMYWFILGLAGIYVFYVFGISILLPFPRLFMFYLIAVAALAGIGLATLIPLAHRIFGKQYGTALFTCVTVPLVLAQYITIGSDRYEYPNIVPEQMMAPLKILKEDVPAGVVISDSVTSSAIYPLTGHHVVGLLSSNIGGGNPVGAQRFLSGDCAEKVATLEKLQSYTLRDKSAPPPLYVLSKQQQGCSFLYPLYESGPYLYEIDETSLATERVRLRTERLTPPGSYTMPDVPVLTDETLHSFLADTTISTDTWIEYLAPDGTIRGRPGSAYTGYWRVDGPLYCYYYPINDTGACNTIAVSDDTVTYFDLNGNKTETAHVRPGNPEGL